MPNNVYAPEQDLLADLALLRDRIQAATTTDEAHAVYRQARVRYYADDDPAVFTTSAARAWWEVTEALWAKLDAA